MAAQVRVTSIEALETFRAHLIVFITQAHISVDEVSDEVRRTRAWIQNDQRTHWEGEIRRRRKLLDQAQQELLSAKLSGLRDRTATQELAVMRTKRAVAEAEDKLRIVKVWNRDYDHRSEPLVKGLDSLRHLLDVDLPKALAYLVQAQKTLESYAAGPAPTAAPLPAEMTNDE